MLGVTVSVRLCVFFLRTLPGAAPVALAASDAFASGAASPVAASAAASVGASAAASAGLSSSLAASAASVALASVAFSAVALSSALGSALGGGASTSYSSTTDTSALESDAMPDESSVKESWTLGRGSWPVVFCLAMSAANAAMPEMLYRATVFGVPGGSLSTSSYASSQTMSASWWKAMVRGLAPSRAPALKSVARLCQSSGDSSPSSFFFVPPLKKPMRPPPSRTLSA